MCGLPGSGKSTLAHQLTRGQAFCMVSADSFFMENGVYQFNASRLPQAHNQCLRNFAEALHGQYDGSGGIIVDNTNCSLTEIAPYYRLAQAYNYKPTVLYIPADAETCAQRNVHGVPLEGILKMETRLLFAQRNWPHDWRRLKWQEALGITSMADVARYQPRTA